MNTKKIFNSLTKKQHVVLNVLCSLPHQRIYAADINSSTLGSLCAKRLVNVENGVVCPTCAMSWNMAFHKEMFDMVTKECMDKMGLLIWSGRRIGAIKVLRETTGWGIHEAKNWMDLNYPK